jgi:hypothetical protein
MYQLLKILIVGYSACFKGDAHREENWFQAFSFMHREAAVA